MKATELRGLKTDELRAKDQELKKELFNLKMRHAGGTLENPLRIRTLRRDVARIKTILRNKEKGA